MGDTPDLSVRLELIRDFVIKVFISCWREAKFGLCLSYTYFFENSKYVAPFPKH